VHATPNHSSFGWENSKKIGARDAGLDGDIVHGYSINPKLIEKPQGGQPNRRRVGGYRPASWSLL
jgi:hypothetical protein